MRKNTKRRNEMMRLKCCHKLYTYSFTITPRLGSLASNPADYSLVGRGHILVMALLTIQF